MRVKKGLRFAGIEYCTYLRVLKRNEYENNYNF